MPVTMLVYFSIALLNFIQEVQTNFDDLGKLLLGGVSAAIVFAVAFTLIRFRLQDKNPPKSNFISIGASREKEEKVGG